MPLTDATSASKNMQLHKRGRLDLAKQAVRIELSMADIELACRNSYSGVC